MNAIEIPTQLITVADLKVGDMIKMGERFMEVTWLSNGGNETMIDVRGLDQTRMVSNTKRVRIAKRYEA